MTRLAILRSLLLIGLAVCLAMAPAAPARAAAVLATDGGSNQVLVYPTPNDDLPSPAVKVVTNMPDNARPHGVSCFDDTCLVTDATNFRVLVVRISTATVVDVIATGNIAYSAAGGIAVNPAKTFALGLNSVLFNGNLAVIAAPFTSTSALKNVELFGAQFPTDTQAIVFRSDNRAFVCTGGAIAVLDVPYSSVAFTIPMPAGSGCGNLALSPDGNTLVAPNARFVHIFTAPFTAGSTPVTLTEPFNGSLKGAAFTSDGSKVLIADTVASQVWVLSAPYNASSTFAAISLPGGFTSLRQVAIGADDKLAIATGGGTNPSVAFIRPPFTSAGATVFNVQVAGGSGFGGVNILTPVIPPPPVCGPTESINLGSVAIGPAIPGVGTVTLVSALLPSSRSVRVDCPATAFVTVINTGAETATAVGIALSTLIPADFLYQTTNPATNALTGTPNTPVNIPVGGVQTYFISLTPRAAFAPTNVSFIYGGTNTATVDSIVGLNTLLLSASLTPVPDVVALAATAGNTGIVRAPAPNNNGAFAVASVNVGASGSITVSADTGTKVLPLALTVCQTNPGTGACLAPPAASVTTTIAGGATPTFAIFVQASGAVAFDPANNRVFVRFEDAGGVTRGSTSVAVTTVP